MYILSSQMEPACTLEFESEILILHHPTTIAPNYQAMGNFTCHYEQRTF